MQNLGVDAVNYEQLQGCAREVTECHRQVKFCLWVTGKTYFFIYPVSLQVVIAGHPGSHGYRNQNAPLNFFLDHSTELKN